MPSVSLHKRHLINIVFTRNWFNAYRAKFAFILQKVAPAQKRSSAATAVDAYPVIGSVITRKIAATEAMKTNTCAVSNNDNTAKYQLQLLN